MDGPTLAPELEQFATEAVAAGRRRDMDELLRTGVDVLRRLEADRAAFVRSLEHAAAESDRDGWLAVEEVEAEMLEVIREAARRP